jgi:hypothetical protein
VNSFSKQSAITLAFPFGWYVIPKQSWTADGAFLSSLHLGAEHQIFNNVRKLRLWWCRASSLTRGRVCRLPLLLALVSAVILGSDILLSQIRDSPNLEGEVPVFISPRNSVAQLYPRQWVPFSSPRMARRARVEVFELASTHGRWLSYLDVFRYIASVLTAQKTHFPTVLLWSSRAMIRVIHRLMRAKCHDFFGFLITNYYYVFMSYVLFHYNIIAPYSLILFLLHLSGRKWSVREAYMVIQLQLRLSAPNAVQHIGLQEHVLNSYAFKWLLSDYIAVLIVVIGQWFPLVGQNGERNCLRHMHVGKVNKLRVLVEFSCLKQTTFLFNLATRLQP